MENEYPKMLYANDGRTLTVASESEERDATGFSDDPSGFYALQPGHALHGTEIDPPAGPVSDDTAAQDQGRGARSKQIKQEA